MKKLFIFIFVSFLSLEFANARGIAIGFNSAEVENNDVEYGLHITLENYARIEDSMFISGASFNYDAYKKDEKEDIMSLDYGFGFSADKKLNFYASYGIAHQKNSSTNASGSLGLGWGIGLSYRLSKQTYAEIKHRVYSFKDDLNGQITNYDAGITSFAVAYMF